MAVVSVTERFQEKSGQEDSRPQRRYVRTFHVTTDTASDDFSVVRQAVQLPKIGDVHNADLGARVEAVRGNLIEAENDPFNWIVTAEYSNRTGNLPGPDDPTIENPLLRPAEIVWSGISGTKPAEDGFLSKDNGATFSSVEYAITNSATEPFDPLPEIAASTPTLTITRNEAAFDPAQAIAFANKVNSDPFFGALAGQARMGIITARQMEENAVVYWRVTYPIQFREEGWTIRLLDRGFYRWDHTENKPVLITDKHGVPVRTPQLLDGLGQPLLRSTDGSGTLPTPVYWEWKVYGEKIFADLNLP